VGKGWGFGDWNRIELAYNAGVAFGITLNYYLIIIFYCAVILILVWYLIDLYKTKTFWPIFACTLILFGAFSNFLDRIYQGKVIDYLYLKNFSILNLADAMITVGAVLLIITTGHKPDKK
jgi:signal peptidase II